MVCRGIGALATTRWTVPAITVIAISCLFVNPENDRLIGTLLMVVQVAMVPDKQVPLDTAREVQVLTVEGIDPSTDVTC